LDKKGDIYKKEYTGNYCSGCERFITDKELEKGKCQIHSNVKIQKLSEENYFFKLSKYSDKIKKLIESDELKISPEKYKKSFLSSIKDGLTDVSFSRDRKHLPWGIPVPGDDKQVMYVWCDALTNYLTGIGYPDKKYKKFWPANIHVVGKDMLRFHTGIWPGMLLSAGLPLPKEVIVHGFLTVDGKKMSKSVGNVISPLKLREKYDSDSIRYFLLRETPFGEDGNFSEKVLISRHNNELADKLGNLVSRVSALIEKSGVEKFDWKKSKNEVLIERNIALTNMNLFTIKFKNLYYLSTLVQKGVEKLMDNYKFDKALNEIFSFIDSCNEYVQKNKIWETEDKKKLYELKESILKISELLFPFLPETSEKIKKQFSMKKIKKSEILFRKI